MAINFLNKVDFNQNELDKARIVNEVNDAAAGTGVVGQLYFDTTEDTLKQYVSDTGGGAAGWIEVGATSAVESIIAGTGIGVSAAIGNVTVRNTGLVTVLDGTYIDLTKQGGGDNTQLTADLSAVDGTSTAADRFLTKANKWATIPFGDVTEVQGGTYITVTNPTGPVPIVNHDATSRSNTTSTAAPAYGATFTALDSITTNTTGHVTAVNTKTITIPASDDTTYDLLTAPTGTAIRLDPSTGTNDDVTISGTTGQTAMSRISASELRVALTDNVTIIGDATIGGDIDLTGQIDMNGSKIVSLGNGTLSSDAVNLGQVEALVAGIGLFKGGYNATTGLTTDLGAGNGSLDGASNIALDQGDFFVVTVAGTAFYTQTLEVGDMIFANTTIAANSTPPISDYTVVIQDANIAGAGATDGATAKGVAGFDSENFSVSASGWVQLKRQANPYGISVPLTGGTDSGGETTFTVDITTAARFGAGALAANCKAEVVTASGRQTVYPDITGNGTGSLDFKFIPTVADSVYTALITIV